MSAGLDDAMLQKGYRCSNTSQTGNRRGEVYESRVLTRKLDAPAVVRDKPDAGGRKETAEVDGDAPKLTILEPRAPIRHCENRVERSRSKLLGGVSAALRGSSCFDDAERSCVGVAGRPGQEDLPRREDEVSDCAGDFVETEPRNHQENAFLFHRRPLSRVGCDPAAQRYRFNEDEKRAVLAEVVPMKSGHSSLTGSTSRRCPK